MRTIVITLLLLALSALAGAEEQTEYRVVTEWKIEKGRLVAKEGAWKIDPPGLAAGLPKGGELSVALKAGPKGKVVVGAWPVSEKTDPKDLALVMELVGPAKVAPGKSPRVSIRIVNRSKTTAHRVVRPNDGSESGWREPHVYYGATAAGKPIVKKTIMRCGLYAEDWHRDIVVLAPGQSLDITGGFAPVGISLELPKAGQVSLKAHYDYKGGKLSKGSGAPKGPGAMGKTPAFSLASEAVEFRIAAP